MAGPTTSGLAALIEGEGWRVVGAPGEPNYQNTYSGNVIFRLRADVRVEFRGGALTGVSSDPGDGIFTLPEGYRPGTDVYITQSGVAGGTYYLVSILVTTSGAVSAVWNTKPTSIYMSAEFSTT